MVGNERDRLLAAADILGDDAPVGTFTQDGRRHRGRGLGLLEPNLASRGDGGRTGSVSVLSPSPTLSVESFGCGHRIGQCWLAMASRMRWPFGTYARNR